MSPSLLGVAALAFISASTGVSAATYPLAETHQGQTFFDGWTFADQADITTSGDVQYVNSSSNPSLAYVNPNGTAVMKVSTETVVYNNKRNSVRINLDTVYDVGTVWVFDAIHIPFGCSVWPAFWTHSDTWPEGGEIDIMEGVNRAATNQMALHTIAGCTPQNTADQISGGTIQETNCNNTIGAGCTIKQNSELSYGEGFNNGGGGVWVTELAETGVSIWFYPRASVPSGLTKEATTVDTSTLGTPVAFWPSTGCSPISDYISKQRTVIDITLCGVWAGANDTLSQNGCAVPTWPQPTCYTHYVIDNGIGFEQYSESYFEINYMSIFSTNPGTSSPISASASSSPSSSNTAASSRLPSASASASAASASGTAAVGGSTGGALARFGSSSGAMGWLVGMVVVGAVMMW